MDLLTARETLNDAAMRKALWEWLWQHHPDVTTHGRPVPCPSSDDAISEDLQRILFPKRKRFLGLF